MSQVIAAYGMSWIALAADRGISWTDADGTKRRGLHEESKLQVVPDLPIAFATTGPAYCSEVIDDYIAHRFDATKRRTEVANEIWAELCDYHKERYGAGVNHESFGDMGQYDLEVLSRASMSMLFADARGIAGVFDEKHYAHGMLETCGPLDDWGEHNKRLDEAEERERKNRENPPPKRKMV